MTTYGRVEVPKRHILASQHPFSLSPYLQELMVYVGESLVFEESAHLLEKLLHTSVNAKQVERVCHHYGALLEEKSVDERQDTVRQDERLHYGMIDGGMILTREESWKEIKVGRVFPAEAVLPQSQKRNFVSDSDYTAHLGSKQTFFEKLAYKTDPLTNMIWIADGARWIWSWVEAHYPNAVQILDYFHCKEKLCQFALHAFEQENEQKQWVQDQQDLLFADAVETVIANIALMQLKGDAKLLQKSLLKYYSNNKERMRYGSFQKQGYLIGSGAIESAIRQLIQQRLKLSGQRWTIKGAQQIANLRVAKKSNKWMMVQNLIANQN